MAATAVETAARGKGRVRARQDAGQAAGATPAPAMLMPLSHSDLENGERPGDPVARFPDSMEDGRVPRYCLDKHEDYNEAMGTMRASMPCVIRGAPLASELAGACSVAGLARAFGGSDTPVEVLASLRSKRRFVECDDAKNMYGSYYHIREPETQRLHMTLPEFTTCAEEWRERVLHTRVPLVAPQTAADFKEGRFRPAPELEAACPHAGETICSGPAWQWLRVLQKLQRFGPVQGGEVEVGGRDGLFPSRYTSQETLMAQVTGRRRVLLFSPAHAFSGLYPYPVHHAYDGYSMVDLEDVDEQMFPGAGGVRGQVVILEPGDLLYVPRYWFAHVQDLEQSTCALRLRLRHGVRPRHPDALPLALSRPIELRVAENEGVRGTRFWLVAMAAGEEGLYADDATVAGYRRVLLSQWVRDEIAAAGGPGRDTEILEAMVGGRLLPTTWLNAGYREPMYLRDMPYQVADTRTEWERKYPEFFREKLREEGWSAPERVSTVPIPGYNT